MTETEFKEKFLCYFATMNNLQNVSEPLPYGDRQKYTYYDSSNNKMIENNTNFEAFRFSDSRVYITVYPNNPPSSTIKLSVVGLFKP